MLKKSQIFAPLIGNFFWRIQRMDGICCWLWGLSGSWWVKALCFMSQASFKGKEMQPLLHAVSSLSSSAAAFAHQWQV
jgi:hypothetical protein